MSEAALFLAPFALLAAWWILGWRARWVFWGALAALLAMVALLVVVNHSDFLAGGAAAYVPAQWRGGEVVRGHGP